MTPEEFLCRMEALAEAACAELATIDGIGPGGHREEKRAAIHFSIKTRQVKLLVLALIEDGFDDGIAEFERITQLLRCV